ncbi:MAG: rod shape-determining protein MreC [Candidatus Saccharimonadia bacterium]
MRNRLSNRVLIVLVVGFVLVLAGLVGLLRPVERVIGVVTTPVARVFRISGTGTGSFFSFFSQIKNLNQENISLSNEVNQLKLQLAADAQMRAEDEILKQQLGFTQASTQVTIPAQVIAFQPDNFRAFITINRGKRDGLTDGMAVLSGGYFIGTLTEVSDDSAKVFLTIDPDFRVAVMDQNTQATGLVHGEIGQGMSLEEVPQDQTIKPGDTLVTSGLGGDEPKGLVIGQIETINHQDNAIFQTAQVVANVNLDQLDLVFVVTHS